MAARLIKLYKARRSCHVTHLLQQLQWLQIERQIEQEILTLTFKYRNRLAPSYLCVPITDFARLVR